MLKIEELERELDRLHAERTAKPVQLHTRRRGQSDALLQQGFETTTNNRKSLPEVSKDIEIVVCGSLFAWNIRTAAFGIK